MSTFSNELNIDNLRIEIAILQEEVIAANPGTAKFIIPAIMTSNSFGSIPISNSIVNSTNDLSSDYNNISMDNTIRLKIPTEYTYFFNGTVVPKGTKFLVSFVGGNINDIRIIARYDA